MKADRESMPDLLLEQYALGELSAAESSRVAAALDSDPSLRARLDELSSSDDSIIAAYPPAEIASSIKRRMLSQADAPRGGGRGLGPRFSRSLALSAAAAAVLLVGLFSARSLFRAPDAADFERAKGGAPGLLIYRKAASGPALLASGDSAAAGDVLQIRYGAGSSRFGAIVSIDGRGSLTWHLPPSGSSSMSSMPQSRSSPRIEAGGALLGTAYELDDAPAFERFFMLSSEDEFDLAKVAASFRVLQMSGKAEKGSPSLPSNIEWRSFILYKTGGTQ